MYVFSLMMRRSKADPIISHSNSKQIEPKNLIIAGLNCLTVTILTDLPLNGSRGQPNANRQRASDNKLIILFWFSNMVRYMYERTNITPDYI